MARHEVLSSIILKGLRLNFVIIVNLYQKRNIYQEAIFTKYEMVKPRLLVLATSLPEFQVDLEYSLSSLLGSRIAGIEVNGSVALPYSIDSLLNWAVLGRNTNQDIFLQGVQRGCELYVGIKTPEREYEGLKTADGRFDKYQLGERGFDLAKQEGIPAILLDNYDQRTICDFVQNQTK